MGTLNGVDSCIIKHKCEEDYAVAKPGQSRSTSLESRSDSGECWYFDTKTGETRRLY